MTSPVIRWAPHSYMHLPHKCILSYLSLLLLCIAHQQWTGRVATEFSLKWQFSLCLWSIKSRNGFMTNFPWTKVLSFQKHFTKCKAYSFHLEVLTELLISVVNVTIVCQLKEIFQNSHCFTKTDTLRIVSSFQSPNDRIWINRHCICTF